MNPSVAAPRPLSLRDLRLYGAAAAMVLGNVLLPAAVHGVPGAGRALLPILFFTLVAGWRYGLTAGLLTAVLSPLANHVLTGMPPTPMLQGLVLQGVLLAALAALASRRSPRPTLALLGAVVFAHQALLAAPALAQGTHAALAVLAARVPAILLQILGGYGVLRLLDRRP